MNKTALITLILTLLCGEAIAKQNIKDPQPIVTKYYLRAGLGYGFTSSGDMYGLFGIPYDGTATYKNKGASLSSFTYNKASFGRGINISIAGGYMFSKHVGFEVGLIKRISSPTYTFNAIGWSLGSSGTGNSKITTVAKSSLFLIPALLMETGTDPVNLYSRIGIVMPLNTKLKTEEADSYDSLGIVTDYTTEVTSYFSLGYTAAIGFSYKIDNRFSIWAELSQFSLTVYAQNEELKSYTQNGQNIPLSQFYNTTVHFSSSNNGYSNDKATHAIPFSNTGINIGLKMNL